MYIAGPGANAIGLQQNAEASTVRKQNNYAPYNVYRKHTEIMHIQWNLHKTDTIGEQPFGYREP